MKTKKNSYSGYRFPPEISGGRHYLWRAVDQDGDVIEILVQRKRNARAAKRFFRKLRNAMQTIWLKCRISRRDNESVR